MSAGELQEMLGEIKISGSVVDFLALFGFRYLRKLIETHADAGTPAPSSERK